MTTFTLTPPAGDDGRSFELGYNAVVEKVVTHVIVVTVRSDWAAGHDSGAYDLGTIEVDTTSGKVPAFHVDLDDGSELRDFLSMVKLGVQQIQEGIDHQLFLLALLIPAPLFAAGRRWQRPVSTGDSIRRICRITQPPPPASAGPATPAPAPQPTAFDDPRIIDCTSDKVAAVEQLSLLGLSAAQIVKRTKARKTEVTQALAASGSALAKGAAERFEFLTLDQAAAVAEDDPDAVKALIAAAKKSDGDFAHVLQRARDDREEAAQTAAVAAELATANVTVIERPDYNDRTTKSLHELVDDKGKQITPRRTPPAPDTPRGSRVTGTAPAPSTGAASGAASGTASATAAPAASPAPPR